jgi:hypothetical protein
LEDARVDIKKIESRCQELTQALKGAADNKDFDELLTIIHKPGWTTPAEALLVHALLESMVAQAKHLAGLKQTLLAGARAVPTK